MGCPSCGAAASIARNPNNRSVMYSVTPKAAPGPCNYNNTNLLDFKKKLIWFKDKGLYLTHGVKARELNKYIGIVITSTNITNKCTYKNDLEKISELVDLIITLQ